MAGVVAVLLSLDLLASTGQQTFLHPVKLSVFNGSGSGEYLPQTPVPIAVEVLEGYEFVKWFHVAGDGAIASTSSPGTTFTMGFEAADVVAALAKIESWFPPGPESGSEGLLLPKPSGGGPQRMEQRIRVTLDRGAGDKPPYSAIWDLLAVKLKWEEAQTVTYFTAKTGGDAIGNDAEMPKDLFEPQGENVYEGSIWYEGNLTQEQMAEQGASLKVTTRLNLVIDGTDGSRVVTGVLLPIEMKVVDRDDPTRKWGDEKDHHSNKPIYAGEKNGDMVRWKLAGTDSWTNVTFTWTAEGPSGTIAGPTGVGKNEWTITDADADTATDWLTWEPGKWKIKVQIGSSQAEFEQEIGVRTTDVVVVGWINPAGVPLDATGMPSDMTRYYPPSGTISSMTQKLLTAAHLGLISAGSTIRPGPAVGMTSDEKTYILRWMFKFAGNSAPPNSFATEESLNQFRNDLTNYKLYNRFQIKYLLSDDGTKFKEKPKILKDDVPATRIGTTIDPIFHNPDPGQKQEADGRQQIKDDKAYHQTNDGSPSGIAVKAFNALVSPLKWNDIGSTITFGIDLGFRYEIKQQVYPTFYIYERIEDGSFYLYQVIPQAATPEGNFNSNPYYPPSYRGPAPFIITP